MRGGSGAPSKLSRLAKNDPTDTGGLFVGRRPGTAPLRYRAQPVTAGASRQRVDRGIAASIFAAEIVLCLSLWGPQPAGWLWVGSQVDYLMDSVVAGILVAFAGMMTTLMGTLALLKRLDHWWKLTRRAAGHEQKRGILEPVFVVTLMIAGSAFGFWFFILEGPGSSLFTQQA
ncbi:MAG: hypothetical protein WD844_08810 [Thermoleophilaceae bacterium]